MKKICLPFVVLLVWTFASAQNQNNIITVYADSAKGTISKYIYGHFSEHLGRCIYGGIWVGKNSSIPNIRGIRKDVLEALNEIRVPVLRWPGGCFADTYHWMDGIGPTEQRPKFVNTTWGGVVEDNSFGTHEFLDLCELLGAEPYISLNVGSGTVREAREWVEYITSDNDSPMANLRRKNGRKEPWRVKFWGIGNETWGCGGNMTPDYYSDVAKQFSTFCNGEFKIFSGGTSDDYNWTETVMKSLQKYQHLIQGYSYHYYTVCHNWTKKGWATRFDESEWFSTMKKTLVVDQELSVHSAIMDQYDPEKKIALIADEWGNWFDTEPGDNPAFLYQQNTLRDAVTAALYLNIFNNHCDRVRMANLAQTVNVLQSVLLTKDDQLVRTPTFYVFKMYTVHHDATFLPTKVQCDNYSQGTEAIPAVNVSASRDKEGKIHITVAHLDPNKNRTVTCTIQGATLRAVHGSIITAETMNAYNDFGKPEAVTLRPFTDVHLNHNTITIELPAKSVVMVEVE